MRRVPPSAPTLFRALPEAGCLVADRGRCAEATTRLLGPVGSHYLERGCGRVATTENRRRPKILSVPIKLPSLACGRTSAASTLAPLPFWPNLPRPRLARGKAHSPGVSIPYARRLQKMAQPLLLGLVLPAYSANALGHGLLDISPSRWFASQLWARPSAPAVRLVVGFVVRDQAPAFLRTRASALRHRISNSICAPASAVIPAESNGGDTSTTSPPTMSRPRRPCKNRFAS
jgi:hypothetical protein